ncbi:methyltransferase [Streptomyces sp. st77]|nr:methyltransferase [Streptomyces sp. st77]MYW98721.1 methyltransferase domain-containing protein [Streptomyces sp. SID8378]SNB91028.1 Dimerisation domain-containing protein [Streptomyces sp. PgraA7]
MPLYTTPLTPAGAAEAANGTSGRMMQMITGYWVTQVVRTAAELDIAGHLSGGPTTAEEIARAASLEPAVTLRFLRACAAVDLVTCEGEETFTATPLLETLRIDHPGSLRDLALWGGMKSHWEPWGCLTDAVRTGNGQTGPSLGADLFGYLAAHPQESERFTAAMAAMTEGVAERLADVLELSGSETVVDVGGAAGAFVQTLMKRHSSLRGVVLDLPHLAEASEESAARAGVSDRFEFVAGDFFHSVPQGDVYLLKYVLHDWDDESAVRILRACRNALNPGGRVLVTELVIDPGAATGLPPLMDLNMLTLTDGGRERSLHDFEALFRRAGLTVTGVTHSATLVSIVEGVRD